MHHKRGYEVTAKAAADSEAQSSPMPDSQKIILMVQPSRLQGLIWQTVLKSQQLSVIWESPAADLAENLDQLKAAGLTLPDLLLVDMQVPDLNPYAFCRWCREQYPGLKLVLTNSSQTEISLSERQWAVNQGASDLLAGFQSDNLVSGVTSGVKRVLEILDGQPLNNGTLISVLLAMKRQLEARSAAKAANKPSLSLAQNRLTEQNLTENKLLAREGNGARFQPITSLEQLTNKPTVPRSNGNGKGDKAKLESGSGNGALLEYDKSDRDLPAPKADKVARDRAADSSDTKANGDKDSSDKGSTDKGKRRYRGLYY